MSFHLFFFFFTKNSKQEKSISIDNCTFHQCVQLSKFDTDRSIRYMCILFASHFSFHFFFYNFIFNKKKKRFIPPDGEFELMKYRTSSNVKIPFKMFHNYKELSKSRLEIKITVKANFARDGKLFNNKINNHHNK